MCVVCVLPTAGAAPRRADGHLSALMKDRDAERAREVLERKAAEHKTSFLGLATPLE